MANRYPPQWLTVHFPHTSTAILKIDVMKRHFEYRPLKTVGNFISCDIFNYFTLIRARNFCHSSTVACGLELGLE